MTLKFGIFVPQGWRLDLIDIKDPVEKYEAMTRVATEAEQLGFDSIWLYDHFHTVPTPEIEATFECWTTTAALARDTSRIRIGQMVTSNSYRNPALLAKMASTVDVLSRGRLNFGIGAGWYEHEYRAYGYPFADAPERLRMLRETLHIISGMWSEPYAEFKGEHNTVRGAINEPKGVQKPHPPIWIGGSGEKVTLRLVALFGDACNIESIDPGVQRHKLSVLRRHCESLERDYSSIVKSAGASVALVPPNGDPSRVTERVREQISKQAGREYTLEEFGKHNLVGNPQRLVDAFGELEQAGVQYMTVYLFGAANTETLHLFADKVLPAFA
jgi:F420-dependent oxidoreductase-like protein